MKHLGMKNGASKSLGLLHVLFSLMSSWFWPFGGWYVDVQHNWHNSFLSPEEFGSYSFRQQRESSLICPKKCCLVKSRVILVMMSERKSTLESPVGHVRESFMTKLTSVSWVVPLPKTRTQKGCFAERFSIITLSLWIWLSADALHSDNFPWGPSYAMSILLWDGDKEDPASVRSMPASIRGHEESSFSSCQLLTHLSKEALWMNCRLPDLVNQED